MRYAKDLLTFSVYFLVALLVCVQAQGQDQAPAQSEGASRYKTAIFAGGCFWCMQPPYDKVNGVKATRVGFAGGHAKNPTYKEVTVGGTGHLEVIEVTYDPKAVSYKKLVEIFWRNVDPYDSTGQFCDKGESYKPAIFYDGEDEKKIIGEVVKELVAAGRLKKDHEVAFKTKGSFYSAEEYHQKYYEKNPIRYKFYRANCGRDKRLEEVWGKDKTSSK